MRKNIAITMLIILAFSIWSQVLAVEKVIGGGPNMNFDDGKGKPVVEGILGVIQWSGYAIAVGAMIYLGIKYVLASADDKATLKGAAWKYILGALLISGAATFIGWIF